VKQEDDDDDDIFNGPDMNPQGLFSGEASSYKKPTSTDV
jgi:hypothetical protein